MNWDAIDLGLFVSRLNAICEEMGTVLRHAAVSSNIKDRLDFSCALFDARGHLCAQAAHIPVHLGSMAWAMRDVVPLFEWQEGDVVVFNDPRCGGTHLPDVTVVMPLMHKAHCVGFAASRAHHAHIGEPDGSMPLAERIEQEGALFAPTLLRRSGRWIPDVRARIMALGDEPAEQADLPADWLAQVAACERGVARMHAVVFSQGDDYFPEGVEALNAYAGRLVAAAMQGWPEGVWQAEDALDDDGFGHGPIPLSLSLSHRHGRLRAVFEAPPAVQGNVNCPLSVTAAAVFYAVRCLLPVNTPACEGVFRNIEVEAPEGSLLDAPEGVAVGAGNVETSQRVVDLMQRALAKMLPGQVPALSQGTMNNVIMSGKVQGRPWHYYETLGGGHGAGAGYDGCSGRQAHMTNTLNTPVEVLETLYPLRIEAYRVRRGSGGAGRWQGCDGIERHYRFLAPARVTLLTERRQSSPAGLQGGGDGKPGVNCINHAEVGGKHSADVAAGTVLCIRTPGGGGYGDPQMTD
ncbi:MAG: hydantoinase B/oxoprolinase family protein [Gammaproteobacteria bacterium]|nr:MAG: hydantoinase B/oxoprolinase family protein [Gammaproteobacteria bacterium]